MSSVDDTVRAVLAGDRDRFRELVAAFESPVRVALAALVPDRAVVDDLVIEVFTTAFLRLDSYDPQSEFRAWIRAIARNVALNARKRWARYERLKRRYQVEVEEAIGPELERLAEGADPELLRKVRTCVEGLKEPARRLVELRYFEGLTGADIARQERRMESWVRVVLHRARAALAQCLALQQASGHG